MKKLLIIFYKNPLLGNVKTRLATSVGDEAALAIYLHLVAHTRSITENLNVDKVVYYSDYIDTEDNWSNSLYQKSLQQGNNLGEKMFNAFTAGFIAGYESICIIGTDCLQLTAQTITDAFLKLEKKDVVLGPASDGGYYLLGMKSLFAEFFMDKRWSTSTVSHDTLQNFKSLNLSYTILPELSDIDVIEDLPMALKKIAKL